jgi:uncharacterized protein
MAKHPPLQFQLLIKPAGSRCNLRCKYCFYMDNDRHFPSPEEGRGKVMSRETLDTMVRELLSYRMPQTVFAWQGGEPTLAGLDFFKAAVEAQQEYGDDGQVVGNALQTNGVLLDDEWCAFLAKYHFLVGLSLDGPRKVHEANRGKSFDKVMAAAERMRKHGVEFNILTVVSHANAQRGAETYRWLTEQGFNDLQFIPCLAPGPHGTPGDHAAQAEQIGDFLVAAFDQWFPRDFGAVSERIFTSLLSHFVHGQPNLCTFQGRCGDYMAVERGGELFPCDFFIQPPWQLGQIREDEMKVVYTEERPRRFGPLKAQVDDECRDCEFFPMCHGGCPRDRDERGRNVFCAGYKKFFAHAAPKLQPLARELRRELRRGPRRTAPSLFDR